MVEVGTKIRELREDKKMTQKELAEKLNVTPQAVSKWERNKSYPDLDMLIQMSKLFQVSTDTILGTAKKSFFASLFSKREGNEMKKVEKEIPAGTIPKAVKAEMMANFLKVTFEHGAVRYVRTHFNQDLVDAFSAKEGKGKRLNILASNRNSWMGTTIKIESDGTVVLNDEDRYEPSELWEKSKEHIYEF